MTTVLITDDDADIRLLLSHLLRAAEFEIAQVENGGDALAYLETHALPDLAILDVQMPEMDGWETLSAIRNDSRTSDLPVILCTVKSTPENVARGWDLGADAYVRKPFQASELIDQVGEVLSRSDSERLAIRRTEFAQARSNLVDRA